MLSQNPAKNGHLNFTKYMYNVNVPLIETAIMLYLHYLLTHLLVNQLVLAEGHLKAKSKHANTYQQDCFSPCQQTITLITLNGFKLQVWCYAFKRLLCKAAFFGIDMHNFYLVFLLLNTCIVMSFPTPLSKGLPW